MRKVKINHCILSGVFGLVAFLFIYGFKVLNPFSIDWLMKNDAGNHYVGWQFLRNAPWTFPFGEIPNQLYPLGTTAANQDVIPIVALTLKLFSPVLGQDFQYFGLWIMVCFVLQGMFGFKLLKELTKSETYALLGSIFFVLSPHFIYRHQILMRALGSHWLILAAMYFSVKSLNPQTRVLRFTVLNCLTVFIHPYLAVMVFGISAASLIFEFRKDLKNAVRSLFLLGAFEIFSFGSLGYFGVAHAGSDGFGRFSANALTFFDGMSWGLFPQLFTFPEQFEGFAYLGGGIIVGLFIAAAIVRKSTLPANFKVIGIVSFLFFFFALSNVVTVGSIVIADLSWFYGLLEPIPAALRASGRLAGPLHFWVIAFVCTLIFQYWPKRATKILLVLLIVQLIDLGPWISNRFVWARDYDWNKNPSPRWNEVTKGKKSMVLVPIHFIMINCYGLPADPAGFNNDETLSLSLVAAKNNLTINSGHDPRADLEALAAECALLPLSLKEKKFSEENLFVVHPIYYDRFKADAGDTVTCEQIDSFHACSIKN